MEALQFAHLHLADGERHRKCRTVAVLSDNDAADTDNSPLPSAQIPFEIAIVIFPIWWRHQYFDIFSQHIGGCIAEQPFRRGTKRLDQPRLVDDHHGFGNAVENRLQMGRARFGVFGARMRFGARKRAAVPHQADNLSNEGQYLPLRQVGYCSNATVNQK